MQVETRASDVDALAPAMRRRVRTDAGRLSREAERRRNRANLVVVTSIVAVLALVRIFYALLTR